MAAGSEIELQEVRLQSAARVMRSSCLQSGSGQWERAAGGEL